MLVLRLGDGDSRCCASWPSWCPIAFICDNWLKPQRQQENTIQFKEENYRVLSWKTSILLYISCNQFISTHFQSTWWSEQIWISEPRTYFVGSFKLITGTFGTIASLLQWRSYFFKFCPSLHLVKVILVLLIKSLHLCLAWPETQTNMTSNGLYRSQQFSHVI